MLTRPHVVLLEHALTSFVADGTIKRVINQQEFHHAFTRRRPLSHCCAGYELSFRHRAHVAANTQHGTTWPLNLN